MDHTCNSENNVIHYALGAVRRFCALLLIHSPFLAIMDYFAPFGTVFRHYWPTINVKKKDHGGTIQCFLVLICSVKLKLHSFGLL